MNEPSVKGVRVFQVRGPWKTKSNGELWVLFAFNFLEALKFFPFFSIRGILKHFIGKLFAPDIDGFRVYTVSGLKKGAEGGGEYHKKRQEFLYVYCGKVRLELEDIGGRRDIFVLHGGRVVLVPPGTLHSYEVLKDNSGLLVICNTTFDPEDPRTHDTYPEAQFRALQEKYKKR